MLNKIILLNSANYANGQVIFDRDSIQIIGGNNVGKTSFISSLLYLYIVDRNKMTFEKKHSAKEALLHYFPVLGKSYIIFEGFDDSHGYFFLLLVRTNNDLEYYLSKQQFDDIFMFKDGKLMDFENVQKNPNLGLIKLRTTRDILTVVFQNNMRDFGFIKLSKSAQGSIGFRDLMNFMFNLPGVNDEVLKKGILLSLGYKDNAKLCANFGKTDGGEKIFEFRKLHKEIENTKIASDNYANLKALKSDKDDKSLYTHILAKQTLSYYTNFGNILKEERKQLSTIISDLEEAKKANIFDISLVEEKITTLSEKKGQINTDLLNVNNVIQKVESYSPIEWIKAELKRLQSERDDLAQTIKAINRPNVSFESLNADIIKIESELKDKKILLSRLLSGETFINRLASEEIRPLLEAVFSDAVIALPAEAVKHPISNIDASRFNFGGGEVDLSSIKTRPLIDRLQIEAEIAELEIRLVERNKEALVLSNLKEEEKRLVDLDNAIHKCFVEINGWESLDEQKVKKIAFEEDSKKNEIEIQTENKNKKFLADKNELLNTELGEQSKKMVEVDSNLFSIYEKGGVLQIINETIKMLPPLDEKILVSLKNEGVTVKGNREDDLEAVKLNFAKWDKASTIFDDKLAQTKELFKTQDGGRINDPDEFIKWLENKIYGLDTKIEKSEEILKSISLIFSTEAKTLMGVYGETRSFVINSFNTVLAGYKISNLGKVQLRFKEREGIVKEMDAIAKMHKEDLLALIHENDDEYSDTASIIKKYLSNAANIFLEDLFDLELDYYDYESKVIKKDQSNGTMKMVRTIVLLIMLRKMVMVENIIPFLFDEVNDLDATNLKEFIDFCREYKLIPLFAGTSTPAYHPSKIYSPQTHNGKLFMTEKHVTYWKRHEQN